MTEDEIIVLLQKKFGKVLKARGGWVRIPCPTCSEKDARHMKRYVHPGSLYTKCWICEQKIDFFKLVGQHVDRAFSGRMSAPKQEHPQAKTLPYKTCTKLTDLASDHPAIQFLHKDFLFDMPYYDSLGIVYIPAGGGLSIQFAETGTQLWSFDSLIFPVYYAKSLVGWQLRWIPGTWNGERMSKMRYLHLFNKGEYLYNYDQAKQHEVAVVCEGVKKALKFPNGVATFGKGISETQLQLIQSWKKVVLMLDGEDKTQELAQKLAKGMSRPVVNIDLRKYGVESPDDLPADKLAEIVKTETEGKW